jgi:RND family efflux transporter MFP subunit
MAKKRYIAVGVLAPALYLGTQFHQRNQDAHALQAETLEGSIPTVAVVHAQPSDPNETITLPGNIEAWFQAPIYAQVSGYVKMWYKDYGFEVKKGDMLAEINTPALDAQTEQARADMESQRAKYELAALTAKRYSAMAATNAVSLQSISVSEANARAEHAELLAAEHNVHTFEALLRFKTIVAPYDGVVISRNINVGDYVTKEGNLGEGKGVSNLFTVADVHKMRLFVSVPESFGHLLKPGLTAEVTVPQFPNRRFTANFLTVAKGFDPTTRTAVTEFTIDNDDRALWPGSFASVKISAALDTNRLTIPGTALVFQEDGTQVAVVTPDHKAHFKNITVTRIRDDVVEVGSGITPQDLIINNCSAAILEGDEVRVVTAAPGYDLASTDQTATTATKPAQESNHAH